MQEVKIKPGKYGDAIALLLRMGAGFQTRFERTLIVTTEQRRALEEAGFIAANGAPAGARKGRAQKTK